MNVHWMNSQLYSVLSMKVTDTPLQTLKAVKEMEGVRGAVAWHRMTPRGGGEVRRAARAVGRQGPLS